jgi:hypothetical protein
VKEKNEKIEEMLDLKEKIKLENQNASKKLACSVEN